MRTEKSYLNVRANMILYIFRSILLLIVRTIFIKVLGEELLGLDGLYTNILYMLSITELGLSNAINFSLYSPLAKKDYKKVSSLMTFYKKTYKIIGFLVIILGLLIMLFLNQIVKDIPPNVNIYLIYLIYLFDTANLYFITYKETLILADQNNYELFKCNTIFYLLQYMLQIIVLIFYKSFILYLVVKIIVLLVQRLFINRYITNKYNQVDFSSNEKLDEKDLGTIKTNIKGLVFHKIGNYVVNGTDNIVISKFINLTAVGIYTNYLSLIMMSNTLLSSAYKGITASFGNLIVMEDKKMQEKIFEKIYFAGHIIYSFVSGAFIVLINNFIELWIGKDYLLPFNVVLILCINFYFDGMRLCIDSIKDASGTYDEDKYIPLIQSVVNIIVSVILVNYIGILGVVVGTLISNILLPVWNRPYIIYKYVFNSSPKRYYLNYIKNFIIYLITTFIILFVINKINLNLNIVNFVILAIIYSIIYIILTSIIYFKNENYIFYVKYMFNRIKKIVKHK